MVTDGSLEARQFPDPFILEGKQQHKVAARALMYTCANTDLIEQLNNFLSSRDRSMSQHPSRPNLRSEFYGSAAEDARRDILFSLIVMATNPKIPAADVKNIDHLIDIIE